MKRTLPALSAVAAVALVSAPEDLGAQEYYEDVRPVLVQNCLGCHTEDGPSWSMEDPERTYERRSRIYRAVTQRRMPPWLAERGRPSGRGVPAQPGVE